MEDCLSQVLFVDFREEFVDFGLNKEAPQKRPKNQYDMPL